MIEYRNAVAEDSEAVDAMARRVWLATFGHSAPEGDIALYIGQTFGADGALVRDLADPRFDFHVALSDGEVIGYCKVGPPVFTHEVDTQGAIQLHQLYVDPAHHGGGVAAALMAWSIDLARARRAAAMLLTVWEENRRAQRFYEKQGFVHVGDYAFRTGTQIDRDLILRLEL